MKAERPVINSPDPLAGQSGFCLLMTSTSAEAKLGTIEAALSNGDEHIVEALESSKTCICFSVGYIEVRGRGIHIPRNAHSSSIIDHEPTGVSSVILL